MYGRITISELFPTYKNAQKWGKLSKQEGVRLVKEYTIVTTYSKIVFYTVDEKYHRMDGPAYTENFNEPYEAWYVHGQRHRTDGPARIKYREDGQKLYEVWYVNDLCHREGNPAHVHYKENNQVSYHRWYNEGLLHRNDGSAIISYLNGRVHSCEWWIQGNYEY